MNFQEKYPPRTKLYCVHRNQTVTRYVPCVIVEYGRRGEQVQLRYEGTGKTAWHGISDLYIATGKNANGAVVYVPATSVLETPENAATPDVRIAAEENAAVDQQRKVLKDDYLKRGEVILNKAIAAGNVDVDLFVEALVEVVANHKTARRQLEREKLLEKERTALEKLTAARSEHEEALKLVKAAADEVAAAAREHLRALQELESFDKG